MAKMHAQPTQPLRVIMAGTLAHIAKGYLWKVDI